MALSPHIRRPVHEWARQWRRVWMHPLVDPESPHFTRAGVPMFASLCAGSLALLVWLTSTSAMLDARVWLFAIVITVTEVAEIRVVPERQVVLNDVFYLVPFVFLPLPHAAALVLIAGLIDPLLHPRPLVRTMARLSSKLAMRLSGLAAVTLARPFVDDASAAGIALLVVAGLLGIRINDYLLFPATIRIAVGRSFSYARYLSEQFRLDGILIAIEVPLAMVAALAYDRAWPALIALVLPYAVLWRLTLLRPRVKELERADELKSEFLSMASHELRTPLTSIQGFAATLRLHWSKLSEEQKLQFLAVIEDQGERLGRLVDDLLTMSRIEAGAIETHLADVALQPLLRQTLVQFHDCEVSCECPPDVAVVADPGHLQQIVINYLSNAIKYGDPPYDLRVDCLDGDVVELRVNDAGPGVPPEFVPLLFDRFTQASHGSRRDAQGTGLGLSIVRELARLQGGDAWYEHRQPNGASFVVRLARANRR